MGKFEIMMFDFTSVVADMQEDVARFKLKHPKQKDVISKAVQRVEKLREVMEMYGSLYFDLVAFKNRAAQREMEMIEMTTKYREMESELNKLMKAHNAAEDR